MRHSLLAVGAALPLTGLTIAAQSSPSCTAATHAPAPAFAAKALRVGRFVYREISGGKDTSTFTLEIRRLPRDGWKFTGEGSGQRWLSIADSSFHPRWAELSMMRKGSPYGFQLRYTADNVMAFEMKHDSAHKAEKTHTTTAIPASTVDQRIDWASLMASNLTAGKSGSYAVYDLSTGASELRATASAGPTIVGPEGPRATLRLDYTICKSGRAESYTVYATTELPRVMLREDLRGDIISELVSIEP